MRAAVVAVVLASSAAACGELPDVSSIEDLRVLGVKCEPAGFLVDRMNPGAVTPAALTAKITALVVDPKAGGQELTFSAVGCPDYIDTITSATLQGTKLCPPLDATSQLPEPFKTDLATVTIIEGGIAGPVGLSDIEYQPTLSFGLSPMQIRDFFTLGQTPIPAVEQSIAYNRDFGLPAIVNLTFDLGGQRAVAIKRVVYWPRLEAGQEPNKNPTLDGIRLYRQRDEATGNPFDAIDLSMDPVPAVSISAGDKLYVEPAYSPAATESYLLNVQNVDTGAVEQKTVERELLRFQFYATVGKFTPTIQFSELNPALSSGTLHTDSEYQPPKQEDLLQEGVVTIWIVVHDERAGTDWNKLDIRLVR